VTRVAPPAPHADGQGDDELKKTVLKYGLIAGAIVAAMMVLVFPLAMKGTIGFDKTEVTGYASMVLAFSMVFAGIRSYREQQGGAITFGKAFQAGILITLICSIVYVVTWEILYYGFFPDFVTTYGAHMIRKLQASGATAAAVARKQREMADFARMYENPLVNAGLTFIEIFPIGLLVTLISAAILRRNPNASVNLR
jgi:hypothetical protein